MAEVRMVFTSRQFHGTHGRLVPERVEVILNDEDEGMDIKRLLNHVEHHLHEHALENWDSVLERKVNERIQGVKV